MQAKQSWLGDQAFGAGADALVNVSYKSHLDALKFMQSALCDDRGLAVVQGPHAAGKTTTVQRLAEKMPGGVAVALVDGTRIKPRELLSRILTQFGYDTGLESTDGLMKMVNMFAVQQTRSFQAPVIIIDNLDRMYPSALRELNTLAALTAPQGFALRFILTGGDGMGALIESDGMVTIAKRNVGTFSFSPLSLREALLYLHARLGACGVNNADTVFPVDVCDRLYKQSGGWPGLMNKFAREAIGRASEFPLRISDTVANKEVDEQPAADIPILDTSDSDRPLPPRLLISKDGCTVADCSLMEKKILIGRSDFADIVIEDDFVSKLHAVMLLYSDALVLLDLNSANGTTVNSVRVRSTVLKDNDIISLGNHRLKVTNAPPISAEMAKLLKTPDTIKMKNLVDMRRLKARQRARAARKNKGQR